MLRDQAPKLGSKKKAKASRSASKVSTGQQCVKEKEKAYLRKLQQQTLVLKANATLASTIC